MTRLWKASAVAILGVAMLAPVMPVNAAPAHRRGHIVVRGGFGSPFFPGFYFRSYDPFWDPYWNSRVVYSAPRPATGELKIKDPMKNASLYIDGGFVGQASKFKNVQLSPGIHRIELRSPSGMTIFQERVNIVLGKTIEIRP